MKLYLMMMMALALTNCSSSGFSSKDARFGKPAAATSDAEAPATQEGELGEADGKGESKEAKESDIDKCLKKVGGEKAQVVHVSHGDADMSGLNPDSVLIIRAQGQAVVDLSQEELSSVKAICLYVRGNAKVKLTVNTEVAAISFVGRGTAETEINFMEQGGLDRLAMDVKGDHGLILKGSLDCSKVVLTQGGSSSLSCNAAPVAPPATP